MSIREFLLRFFNDFTYIDENNLLQDISIHLIEYLNVIFGSLRNASCELTGEDAALKFSDEDELFIIDLCITKFPFIAKKAEWKNDRVLASLINIKAWHIDICSQQDELIFLFSLNHLIENTSLLKNSTGLEISLIKFELEEFILQFGSY